MEHFSIQHTVKSYPQLPYHKMKDAVLGSTYTLSLVFIGKTRAQRPNQETRGKSYVPNILSFPLSKEEGEIYITPSCAEKEAHNFNLTEKGYVGFLFIHGLLHLKGLTHGALMDAQEKKLIKAFKLK